VPDKEKQSYECYIVTCHFDRVTCPSRVQTITDNKRKNLKLFGRRYNWVYLKQKKKL